MPDQLVSARARGQGVTLLEAFGLIGAILALTLLAAIIGGPLHSVALYQVACLGAPLFVFAMRRGRGAPSLGLTWWRPWWVIAVAAVAGVLVLVVNLAFVLPNNPWQAEAVTTRPLGAGPLPLALVIYALIPAVTEELVFRGVLLRALAPRHPLAALTVSTLLFSGYHFSLARLGPTLVLGAVAGALVLASRSVWPAIALHIVNNAAVVILFRQGGVDLSRALGLAALVGLAMVVAILIWLTKRGEANLSWT